MNVSEYVWKTLADHGVKRVYALIGGGCMFLADALARQDRIRTIFLPDEQSCGKAAIGEAQYNNALAVCLVTSGPGGTNAVTGCAASWIDSTPVLFISGQCATDQMMKPGQRQGGPQEVDIVSIVRPITKIAWTLISANSAKYWLEQCIQLAYQNPSGPVWLEVPLDVQSAEI